MTKGFLIFFILLTLLFSPQVFAESGAALLQAQSAGLSLLTIGIFLIITELYLFTFGFLAVSGFMTFILGSYLLFNATTGTALSWPLLLGLGVGTLFFLIIIVILAYRAQQAKQVAGKEGFIGKHGIVLSVTADKMTVQVLGEIWQAHSPHPLTTGQKIRVTHLSGLELTVEPLAKD